MLMQIDEARKSIKKAISKFNASLVKYWTSQGTCHQLYELPSGTQLKLSVTPHSNGSDIEIVWQWILTAN